MQEQVDKEKKSLPKHDIIIIIVLYKFQSHELHDKVQSDVYLIHCLKPQHDNCQS